MLGRELVAPRDANAICLCAMNQDTYQQTHPVLFSDRAVYVVAYDLRTSISSFDLVRLVMNVTIRCPEAPVLIVGTHCDLVRRSGGLMHSLRHRFPQV
jgi:leucine-rich repeat kinase 2